MQQFMQNEYVQLAVLASGLIALAIYGVQAFRYVVIPAVSILKNGLRGYLDASRAHLDAVIARSLASQAYLTGCVIIIVIRLFNALLGVLLAAMMILVANFQYVPGFRNRSLTMNAAESTVNAVAVAFLVVACAFFFANLLDATRFSRRLRAAAERKIG